MNNYLLNRGQDINANRAGQGLLETIIENLSLAQWNFHLNHTNFVNINNLVAIYDSVYCRISFVFSLQQTPRHDELVISYGRSHAQNEEPYMNWRGKNNRCWHNILIPLRFLDGLSPSDAVHQSKTKNQSPVFIEKFRKSELGVRLFNEYPPKASIAMHSAIWQHYGQKLFALFDLRNPKLWDEYEAFVKEYYKLLDIKASFGPPYENIC